MLKLFFYRSAPLVYVFNGIAFAEILFLLWKRMPSLAGGSYFLMLCWLILNLLNWIPWYPKYPGKLGIRLHFQKNIVPTAYLFTLAFGLKLAGFSEWAMLPFCLLMLPILYVSGILLYLHFRDSSELMPGYFSHHHYLKEEQP